MDCRTKSDILRELSECIDNKNNVFIECLIKKTNTIAKVNVTFEEQQTFKDENGVEWVRK